MMEIASRFIANWMEALGLLLIHLLFFAKNVEWNKKKLHWITGFFSITLAIYSILAIPVLLYILFSLLFVCTILLCTRSKIYNFIMIIPTLLFFTMLYAIPVYILELGMGLIPSVQDSPLLYHIRNDLVDTILTSFLFVVLYRCRKHKLDLHLSGKEIGTFCLYFLFCLFENFMIHYVSKFTKNWICLLAFGIITFLIVIGLLFTFVSYLMAKRKNKQLESDIRKTETYLFMQLKLLEREENTRNETSRLRHDLNNHLQVISELHASKNYSAAEKYIRNLSGRSDISKQMHFTGNQIADIVLSTKKDTAEKSGIRFTCDGHFQGLNHIEPIDVCTIFSNLLDNAIEATVNAKEPFICVEGTQHTNYCMIKVANTVPKPLIIKNNHLSTTKPEKKHHGLGIPGVKSVIHKYNGDCVLSCENTLFCVKIILPMS